jgi:type IV secretion system protein VirB3
MKWGVTLNGLIACFGLTAFANMATGQAKFLLLVFPIYGIAVLLCAYDPRFFELVVLWARMRRFSGWTAFRVDAPDSKGRRKAWSAEIML